MVHAFAQTNQTATGKLLYHSNLYDDDPSSTEVNTQLDPATGGYILKDTDRKIHVRNMGGGFKEDKAVEFINNSTLWNDTTIINHLKFTQTVIDDDMQLYYKLIDDQGNVLFEAHHNYAIMENSGERLWVPSLIVDPNNSYTLEIWERNKSLFSSDNLIADFIIQPNQNFSANHFAGAIEWSISQGPNPGYMLMWAATKAVINFNNLGIDIGLNSLLEIDYNFFGYPGPGPFRSPPASIKNCWTAWNAPLYNKGLMFGGGQTNICSPIVALDIVGHEFGHFIFKNIRCNNFVCSNNRTEESKGIEEAFCDILGLSVVYYTMHSNSTESLPIDFWNFGSDFFINNASIYRNFSDPLSIPSGLDSDGNVINLLNLRQSKYYKNSLWNISTDRYRKMGPLMHWFYAISEGGTFYIDENDDNVAETTVHVNPIGFEMAFNLFYTFCRDYLDQNDDYLDLVIKMQDMVSNPNSDYFADRDEIIKAWQIVGLSEPPETPCLLNNEFTAQNGSLTDGSGFANYNNNLNCQTIISPNGASEVTLEFSQFDLASSPQSFAFGSNNSNNLGDSVVVYDGPNEMAPILGTFSASNPPTSSITSSGSSIFLKFDTDGGNTAQGWSANYSSTGSPTCSGLNVISDVSGSLHDGSGADSYTNNANCTWLIAPQGASEITNFSIDVFDVVDSKDTLFIFEGSSLNGIPLDTLVGSDPLINYSNLGPEIFLFWKTNTSQVGGGWDISYNSDGTSFCMGNSVFTNSVDTIYDGSGTGQYQNNTFCTWQIAPTNATSIQLHFIELDVQSGVYSGLNNPDEIRIYDGPDANSPLIGSFSGNAFPGNLNSTGGEVYIEFETDQNITEDGWAIAYSASFNDFCAGTTILESETGTFDDGSPGNYNNSTDCRWLIAPENAISITLEFNSFDLEATNDVLVIYDGPDVDATVLDILSGSIPPNYSVYSNGGYLLVRLLSNEIITADGFEATYTSNILSNNNSIPIVAYEYWFDDQNEESDRIGFSFAPTTDHEFDIEVQTSFLSRGEHTLHYRVQDQSGQWSTIHSQNFFKEEIGDKDIVAREYWYDNQNGESDRIGLSFSSTDNYNFSEELNTVILGKGEHTLHYRTQDLTGLWSTVQSKTFVKSEDADNNIVAYEYWFDDANGESERIGQSVGTIANHELDQILQTTALERGEHMLHYRTQNATGKWSTILIKVFQKHAENDNELVQYEYWINNDLPAITVSIDPSKNYTLDQVLDLAEVDSANYAFKIRFKDELGRWSTILEDSMLIDTQPILCNDPCYAENGTSLECSTFLDSDGDGVCDFDDLCLGFDDNLIGTSCDDGDPCTIGDIWTSSCECEGTLPSNSCDPICTLPAPCDDGDDCTINDTEFLAADGSICVPCQGTFEDADDDGVCDNDDQCPGFDDNLIGMSCDDGDSCTSGDVWTSDCICEGTFLDSDNDGVCDIVDECPNFDNSLFGTPCDDGDDCTLGDFWTFDCECAGSFEDQDNDGVCDFDDLCPDFDNNLIGTPCDDGNPCTTGEVWTSFCECEGIGLSDSCDSSCTTSLPCDDGDNCTENDVEVYANDGSICTPCQGVTSDMDGDGVCDSNDLCPGFDDNLIGSICDDLDDCTINDIWTLDCNCEGIYLDSDSDGTCDENDGCPNDPNKIAPGDCGCGVPDADSDGDGMADCNDLCPNDPNKIAPEICGCGIADEDANNDGLIDCLEDPAACEAYNFENAPNGLFEVQNTGTRLNWNHYSDASDGCIIKGGTIGSLDVTAPYTQAPGQVLIQGGMINGLPNGYDFSATLAPSATFTLFNPNTFPAGGTGGMVPGAFYKWQVRCGCLIDPFLPLPDRLGSANIHISPWSSFDLFTNLNTSPFNPISNNENQIIGLENVDIEIFPNPFEDELIISFSQVPNELSIFNSMGQKIYHTQNLNDYQFKCSTFDFSTGIYFISFIYDEIVYTRKIVKQ